MSSVILSASAMCCAVHFAVMMIGKMFNCSEECE
uniref:Uncharacterized protein n=1 Tax=Anguilla anguilla TaxID=7936 RepID=A0A0E9PV09_ANGAN